MPEASTRRITSGQLDFSAGVDSNRPPTIASESNPHGLKPNQLGWAVNCSMRGGGVTQRWGWVRRAAFEVGLGKFQCASMYQPVGNVFPYIMAQIAGNIFRVRVDDDSYRVENLSDSFFLYHPAGTSRAFMCQGARFLICQAGDFQTLPIFWDGVKLFRSRGSVPNVLAGGTFTVPNIGQPTLVTGLTAGSYTGEVNQTFTIGEYTYQQVEPDQRYTIAANIYANWVTVGLNVTIPNGYQFTAASGFGLPPKATFFQDVEFTFGGSSNPNPGTTSGPVFLVETDPIDTSGAFLYASYFNEIPGHESDPTITNALAAFPGTGLSCISLDISPNPLAAPAADEVWLINRNDPRAGESVTVSTEFSQLPAGGPMDYYQGRLWIANGREYMAGDIVGSAGAPSSGTGEYNFEDSILNISENTFLEGGGTFAVPDVAGNIRAIKHTNQQDTSTGDGLLFVFTRETIYSVNVPVTRTSWASLSEPIQRIALFKYGTSSDWSVVPVNGDLFFQSVDGIRSLTEAIRYFGQWGNVPISSEETMALSRTNRGLLSFGSGILFDNRLLQTCLGEQTDVGVIHRGIIPLDFDLISTLSEKLPPAWEGLLEGLEVLQLLQGDFGGRERAFAIVRSSVTGGIEVWELTLNETTDQNSYGEARVSWLIETPSYTWNDPFSLKELETLELWIDKLYGTVDFQVWYRPNSHPCWKFWHAWQECAARSPCELLAPPVPCDYPYPTPYKQQYRATMLLPKPEPLCNNTNGRPLNLDYAFQFRILIRGYCRIRGLLAHALPKVKSPWEGLRC